MYVCVCVVRGRVGVRGRGLWGGILIEINSTVGELSEGSLLLDLGSLDGVLRRREISTGSSAEIGP